MAKRKRGRPRTGHDPVLGVRVPGPMLRKIGKIAAALSTDRSGAVRWLIEQGLVSDMALLLLRSSRGKRATDRVVAVVAAEVKASAAERAAERAGPAGKVEAEIKALRATQRAMELGAAEADRLALARAQRAKPSGS
jgi:hypothetical protein